MKNIGFIIADEKEFAPLVNYAKTKNGEFSKIYGLTCVIFKLESVKITAIHCGIGKINATFAATLLAINYNIDIILNFGLSGAISGMNRNDIAVGTKFIEHDFDLSPLGYKQGEKPQDISVYDGDEKLTEILLSLFPNIKKGVFVSGDQFIASKALKKELHEKFAANCVDMESAAIAYVCHSADIPFLSVRKVSDDAGDEATSDYTEMNDKCETDLVDIITAFLEKQDWV